MIKNSGRATNFNSDNVDLRTTLTIKQGYTDAANNTVSPFYDKASHTWQKNYEIGRLYATEIMALGLKCPPWPNTNKFPPEIEVIIALIQEHYKIEIVPSDIESKLNAHE